MPVRAGETVYAWSGANEAVRRDGDGNCGQNTRRDQRMGARERLTCERNPCAAAHRSRSLRPTRNLPMLRIFNGFCAAADRARCRTGRLGARALGRLPEGGLSRTERLLKDE